MKTTPSETMHHELATRLCEWAKTKNLNRDDANLIGNVAAALRTAGDTILDAGFLATAAANPEKMRLAWSAGSVPVDPATALERLKKTGAYVLWGVECAMSKPDEKMIEEPEIPESYRYLLAGGCGNVRITSPFPMNIDEIRAAYARACVNSGRDYDPPKAISQCDGNFNPQETVVLVGRGGA